MQMTLGPQTEFADELHRIKYRADNESFREAMNRVASGLTDGDELFFRRFRDILLTQRFIPGGRVQLAVGSTRKVTPFNCYVSGTIEDSFTEGHGSIMNRATEAAKTMRLGGGIGYDFSPLRPRGELIRKLGSSASGPVSFMNIFNAVCGTIASAGHRRGAQMGVLRVDHPDVEEFIHAKQNSTNLTNFNISLAVTDEFMEALLTGRPFDLRWQGQVYRTIDPQALWEQIMRSTWDWAEPGVLFIDTINRHNNLWYCETIAATNPCAEQPLPPYGACLLGSFNLAKYVSPQPEGAWSFDWDQLRNDVGDVTWAMDNVVDVAIYPLYEQEREAKQKRRMGLGVTGLANAGEAVAGPYGSAAFLDFQRKVLELIQFEAYQASMHKSKVRGSFPLFDATKYAEGAYLKSWAPPELLKDIQRYGLRNSHLTSIAPTGTISLTADNCSSGIEPVFSYGYTRLVNFPTGPREVRVEDYGVRVFGHKGKVTSDVTLREHLDVLTAAYRHVDSAVSKTCNVPSGTPWADFKSTYEQAWANGCKGCTTFNIGGKRFGVLRLDEESGQEPGGGAACAIDPETGGRSCDS